MSRNNAFFTEAHYGPNHEDKTKNQVVLVCPHGANGEAFLNLFPEIMSHPEIQKIKDLFLTYLRIEQDYGSQEVTDQLAQWLSTQRPEWSILTFSIGYPRAIVDGGRLPNWCIRPCLPSPLLKNLQKEFLEMHEATIAEVRMRTEACSLAGGVVIDIHTMASYSPAQKDYPSGTMPVKFEQLQLYVDQFIRAPVANARPFDLITDDGKGNLLAFPPLVENLKQELNAAQIAWAENEPYAAIPEFMMHDHLVRSQAVALDIPKGMLSVTKEDSDHTHPFDLSYCVLDAEKMKKMVKTIGKAILSTLK
ncbi:MAG: hypothetical protein CMP10_04045 [Zetaproteobacteria bacterium]|nr:hypothetical protein [Pseudobdellovibrionaceae bacterium]